ncbi:MAG TPA: four helix bundle protein [Gemmatimonadaceae bacterium]|nr:four helix bundle protein [Gemmatimonadaceae bacterium]
MIASDFRDLRVWQKSMDLAVACSLLARRLPPHERYASASQLRRCAASNPMNIAEGNFRLHPRDYLRHLSIARGSLGETITLLELIRRLPYVAPDELEPLQELADHVGRMLTKLTTALRSKLAASPQTLV